ncbi:hypothetical protein QUA43_25590 [Microcoleus sp. N9_B4]
MRDSPSPEEMRRRSPSQTSLRMKDSTRCDRSTKMGKEGAIAFSL